MSNPIENNMDSQRQPEVKEEVKETEVELKTTNSTSEENDSFEIDLDSIKF